MSRLVLFEGIPGSGKTTAARRLAELLRAEGHPVRCYLEGEPNPVDLAWHWWSRPLSIAACWPAWMPGTPTSC